jgi:hypothetical protein
MQIQRSLEISWGIQIPVKLESEDVQHLWKDKNTH